MHVHVQSPEGDAKFWMEPSIKRAQSHGIPERGVITIRRPELHKDQTLRPKAGE